MASTISPTIDRDSCMEDVKAELNRALEEDSPEMKNYHIRTALQYCVIAGEVAEAGD